MKRGEKCRMVAVYDKILYRVIHDAARKMIKKRKIIASVETALKSVVKKNKEEKIKNWLERFNQKAVEDLISDSEDISIIINMIYIYQNSVFAIRWIDGTETGFQTNLKEQSKGIYHGLKPAKNYQTNADSGNRI